MKLKDHFKVLRPIFLGMAASAICTFNIFSGEHFSTLLSLTGTFLFGAASWYSGELKPKDQ